MSKIFGNLYNKYGSKNPLVKWVTGNFVDELMRIIEGIAPVSILDVGCGEGFITTRLHRIPSTKRIVGVDNDRKVLNNPQAPKTSYVQKDIYGLDISPASFDLVLSTEVLEHLSHPEKAVENLCLASKGYIIITVPKEPLWRIANIMRLKYLSDLGNTPGHLQNWTTGSFRGFLKRSCAGHGIDEAKIFSAWVWNIAVLKKT